MSGSGPHEPPATGGDPGHASLWMATVPPDGGHPPLREDARVDVAIIGAGIVGVTAAALLRRAGREVALLDAGPVAAGVTGHTTAKVTALHRLVYDDLVRLHGHDRARGYAESQAAAIGAVRDLAAEHGADCELSEATAYTFAESDEDLDAVRREVGAARALGLPARLEERPPLPFPVAGAVGLDGQALFHPRRHLMPLAATVARDGGRVHEHTRVVGVDAGDPCRVRTEGGHEVRAEHVIVATSLPILDRGLFFARTSPHRSYALAVEPGPSAPDGMFINASGPARSVRPATLGGRPVLVLAGEGHPVGEEERARDRWARLEEWGRSALGAGRTLLRWSAQDHLSADRVPFIGPMVPGQGRVLTATGFGEWGMASGTLAGMLLADRVTGRENRWAWVYDPARVAPRSLPSLARKGAHDARRLVGARLRDRPGRDAAGRIPPGEARVLRIGGERVAVHRDSGGALHAVGAVCTHLGCVVAWNDAEASWDCPCHGSRFDPDGRVLDGPATAPLPDRRGALGSGR